MHSLDTSRKRILRCCLDCRALLALAFVLGGLDTIGAETLRLLPLERSATGWRIAWVATPEATYELQRWDGLAVDASRRPSWEPVIRVRASANSAFVEEPYSFTGRRFYRIALLSAGPLPDSMPPTLAGFQTDLLGTTESASVHLHITATDASGIREVQFLADTLVLGTGRQDGSRWSLEVPYSSVANASRLVARATDNAGNSASTQQTPPPLSGVARRFSPLDTSGRPIPNASVNLAPGLLPPLRFLPGGAVSERSSLAITLPQGAQLVVDGSREVLRFNAAEIRLGRDAAFQLDLPSLVPTRPALHAPPISRTLTAIDGGMRVVSSAPLELPTGPISATDVESLLGLPPGQGVPLRLFDRFDLRWHSGVLEDAGIRGGRFAFTGLPLPALSGDYPDHVLPLTGTDEVRLPYHGRYTWPGGDASARPEFQLGAADPGWLTLRPDGSLGWHNRSEIRFPNGGRMRVDIGLDDPLYRFAIFADSVQVPLIGNLADLILPDNPSACLDPGLDPAVLTRATGCLDALGLAYWNVSASAVAAAPIPENPDAGGLPLPPDDIDTSVSVLNAWGHRAVASVGAALPMAPQRELFSHTGQSAAAATDLASAARHRAALARAAAALQRGGLSGSPDDIAALNAALDEATAAALLRARSASGTASYNALLKTLEALVETQALLAEANRPQNIALHNAVGERLREFLDEHFQALDIQANQFSALPDSPVGRMNRFTAFQHLHDLLDTLAQAALLGIDDSFDVPFLEALTQMAHRFWILIEGALAESEASQDLYGFLFALEDLLDLQASRQLAIFPDRPELDVIPMPGSAAFESVITRLEALLIADLARPYPERSLNNEQIQLGRLARILREVPPEVTLAAAPFERAHERLNAKIADAVAQPTAIDSLGQLLALVELGMLNEQLRRRMNLPATADWEGVQLPALVSRLVDVAKTQRAWSELNRARVLLLNEARRFALVNDAPRRRRYLEQSIPALVAARDVAVALWQSERARRDLSPLDVADLLLPGDLRIDRIAGAAMGDRRAGWITGAFRGRLGLPKFDGRFEVLNASFDQSGTFNLAAHGSASFRGVTLGISQRQPLTVSFRAPGPIRLHGEGILALPNGMSFSARITYDDPTYGFRFEARDLRLDLARDLTLLRPTLNADQVAAAGDELRATFTGYFASMNAALETLAQQAGNLPDLDTRALGRPPTFAAPQITLPFSELNAWSDSILLSVRQNANRSHATTVSSLRQVFQTLRDDATLAAETLDTEAQFLDLQLQRVAVLRRASEPFAAADARLLLGETPDAAALQQVGRDAARAEAKLHLQYLAARPPQSLADVTRNTTVLLDIAAAGQIYGADFSDLDEDGIPNTEDSCPALWSSAPLPDSDSDGFGDACDPAPNNPAVPESGPCSDVLRLAGQPALQAQALTICQYRRELTALGFHPLSGGLVDTNAFHKFSAEELEFRQIVLLQAKANADFLGLDPNTLPSIHTQLISRRIALLTADLKATPESDAARRLELAADITHLQASAGPGIVIEIEAEQIRESVLAATQIPNPELTRLEKAREAIRQQRSDRLDQRLRLAFAWDRTPNLDDLEEPRRRGVVGDSLLLLKQLWGGLHPDNAPYRTRVDQFIRFTVDQLRADLIDPQFLGNRLDEAGAIARSLSDFFGWAAETLPADATLIDDLRLTLSDFTVQLTTVAEARRAWWLLAEHARILDTALRDYASSLPPTLQTTLRQSFSATVLASDRILSAFASLLDAADVESFKVRLPGELRVRRAFGGIVFDRETEVWTGHFGGRLEFPDFEKAFFEISQATLATDGSFQIAAATGGPLPFGRLGLTSSLQVAGSLAGLQSVTGSGQLSVPLTTTTNLFAVTVGYDFNANRLRFDTQANGLDWRLDDDFVLFNGGFGIEFSTTEPDGALTFRGSAGLFARQTPLPASLSRTNFHLLVTNTAVRLAATTNSLSLALTNGTLLLPEFFRTSLCTTNRIFTNFLASPQGQTSLLHAITLTNPPAPPSLVGPAIALSPSQPITVSFPFQPNSASASASFSGALQFRDLGYQVPGFETLEFAICQARLVFPSNQVAYLTNLYAALQFPLPNQTNILEVVDAAAAFSLDGLPTGTIRLRTNLDLYREGDWRVSMLGSDSPLCPAGTGFTLKPDPAFDNRLTLRFDAGMALAIPASILSDAASGPLTAASCGFLSIPFDRPPFLGVDALGLAVNRAQLGGSKGLTLTNLSLQVSGLTNLFSPSVSNPFQARLGGTVLVGPAGFGLSNAVFHFEGQPLPRFTVSELAVIQPGTLLGLSTNLPMQVDEGRIRFLRDDLPIPALFAATNLAVTVSGGVALPSPQTPVLASRVRDLVVTFLPNGQPHLSIDGIGFTIDLTAIVGEALPLALGGEVYIGGLNSSPPRYLFAGKLKGNLKGNAVEALVALDACGLRGVCFGLAGSEVNISIGYGFVLTGARGGLSFANVSNDPCSFTDQLPIDPFTGRPTGPSPCASLEPPECEPSFTLADLQVSPVAQALHKPSPYGVRRSAPLWIDAERQGIPSPSKAVPSTALQNTPFIVPTRDSRIVEASHEPEWKGSLHANPPPAIPCPTLGECPPAAVNILCMPHPDSSDLTSPNTNRIIYKFTSINEPLLNAVGITPEAVANLVPNFSVNTRAIALNLASTLRTFIDSITPRAPADAPPEVRALDAGIDATLDQVELGFANTLHCAIRDLPPDSQQLADLLYTAIRDAAYAGVPCQDLTLKLEGSVSYVGLASFANVTGGVVLSTTGSAGVVGSVNVLGIPVGQARAFVSSTDAQGNPILPSMCGEIIAALGPLELGSLAYLNDCPDCTTALFSAFANLPARLSNAYTYAIMQQAFPELANPALNVTQHLALLDTPERQMAFLAAMMGTPPRDPNGQIPSAFLDFIVELADAVQPRWAMCGEVQPKLFGFPLSGGGKLYGYEFYAGPNIVDGRRQGYLLRDAYSFSPIQMMANYATAAFTGGLGGLFVPALDEAQVSTSLLLPTFGQIARDFFTLPTPEFAARRTRDFLANASQTFQYRLAPLGMELGRAGGRILLPSLDHHPRGPSPRTPPALRNQGLPSELEVLLAALGDKDQTNAVNRLSDVSWRGEGNADFAAIFAGSPFANAVARQNLSLRDDYFPHGGFLGAGILDFPALLASPIPPSLGTAMDATQPTGTRLIALQDFVSNHLLKTERVGEMAFYLPAPNPPLDRFPTTPQELIESLRNFVPSDPLQLSSYYPLEEGFFSGWIEAPILGLPTVRSKATWEPQRSLLRLDAEVPTNSWFNRYVSQARFTVELRGNTNQPDTVTALFTPLSNRVARLTPTTPGLANTLVDISRTLPTELANGLPKFALALSASQVRIPVPTYNPNTPLTDAQTVARIGNATLEAYSPYYRLPGATGANALDRVRRDGGFAVLGDFNFLNGVIQIPRAEFAVSPNPNPLGLPVVTGSFAGNGFSFFGIPFGAPPAAGPALQNRPTGNARIEFRSDASTARLDAHGSIAGLNLGPLFSLAPLSGSSIGATASFATTTSALPQGTLALAPCRLTGALLGGTVARVHGIASNDPFTLSTAGPWNASVTVDEGSGLSLQAGNQRVLRLTRSTAASNQPFRATLSGEGLAFAEMAFTNLHLGLVLETYPDAPLTDPRRHTFTITPSGNVSLQVASDGTFDFRATVPQALPFAGTPLASLQAGFELRLRPSELTFSGTATGGLWSALGGAPLAVTLNASATGITFRAEAGLPAIDFGIFRIDDGSGRGPGVSVTQTGISMPEGLTLRVNLASQGSPTLSLERFVIGTDGAFDVQARRAGFSTFDGLRLDQAVHRFSRTVRGTVTYAFVGDVSPQSLPGFGSIAPRSGSTLRANASIDSTGNGSLFFDAALLRLPLIGVTVDALLHGAASTNAPFGFSSSGPWSAVATFPSLIADPPGTALPEYIRLTPNANAAAGLFTAAVTGNQGNLTSLTATRTGSVNFELFRGSPMAKALNNINPGTLTLSVTNNPRQLTLTLDPPDLGYSTNFVVNDKPISVDLFRLSSGKLTVILASDSSTQPSLQLDAPSLNLLPGSLLEQTLTGLPTQYLTANAFPVLTGTPVRTLAFPGLPVIRLPSGTSNLLTLTVAGFSSPIPFQEGITYDGLLTLPSSSSLLSLDFTGARLRLRFESGPTATVLGRSLSLNGGEATLDVATGGGFTGTFRTTSNPPRNLGFNLIGFQPSGTLTLSGIASTSNPQFSLAGNFNLALAYPNPANPTQTLTHSRNVAFDLEANENFSATITSDLPSFDLGWLRVQRGDVGNAVITRNGSTGEFTLAFNDWDIRLLGVDYNNQDFSVSSTGTLSRNLPNATFNLGSGNSLLRLVAGGVIPFEWVAAPTGTGRTFVDLPSTTTLSFPDLPNLTGTLRDGFAFASALADIPATGAFDHTWNRALTMNNLNFGAVSARLRRVTHNGPIEFTATRSNALWTGLNLSVSANTGSSTSFAASLNGTFSVGGWNFGTANFTYNSSDPSAPFQGTASITDPDGDAGLTFGILLRGGTKPCLEFRFNGFQQQVCQP